MDILRDVFEDTTKIEALIGRGYKIMMIGGVLHSICRGIVDLDTVRASDRGVGGYKLYFVCSDPSMASPMDRIGRVNVDLDEFVLRHDSSNQVPTWSKIRAGVKYPFECYIYIPGDGTVDGPCPKAYGRESEEIVNLYSDGEIVSYVPLHVSDPREITAKVLLGDPDPGMYDDATTNVDTVVLHLTGIQPDNRKYVVMSM